MLDSLKPLPIQRLQQRGSPYCFTGTPQYKQNLGGDGGASGSSDAISRVASGRSPYISRYVTPQSGQQISKVAVITNDRDVTCFFVLLIIRILCEPNPSLLDFTMLGFLLILKLWTLVLGLHFIMKIYLMNMLTPFCLKFVSTKYGQNFQTKSWC